MTNLTEDIKSINTHGIEVMVAPDGTYADVKAKNVNICVTKRPFYCDRGRYGVIVDSIKGNEHIMDIDGADGFPRYFFNLQRLFDELHDWMEFNTENINK